MAKVFEYVRVYPRVEGGTLVEWALHPSFNKPGTFEVQWSHSGVADADDWKQICLTTYEVNLAVDPERRLFGQSTDLYYRVLLHVSDDEIYTSNIEPAYGSLCRREYLIAREITRQELQHMNKGKGGSTGLLFRRKQWGVPCDNPGCLNTDTNEPTKSNCPVCLGTGFKGGYFPGVPYCLIFNAGQQSSVRITDQGNADTVSVMARSIPFPMPQTYDFYLEDLTDRRWVVGGTYVATHIRNAPVVVSLELRLAPTSDVIQTVTRNHGLG